MNMLEDKGMLGEDTPNQTGDINPSLYKQTPIVADTSNVGANNKTGLTAEQRQGIEQVATAAGGAATSLIGGLISNKDMREAREEARVLDKQARDYEAKVRKETNALREREMRVKERRSMLNMAQERFRFTSERLKRELENQITSKQTQIDSYTQLKNMMKDKKVRNLVLNSWSKV